MKYYLFIVLLCVTSMVFAQQSGLDSLLRKLPETKDDTSKVLLYIAIGNASELNDLQKAGNYYLLARDLSERIHYRTGIIKFISNYTGILNINGAFDSSLLLNKQAIEIAKELKDRLALAKSYANTGNSFNYLSEYDSAIYYYETAGKYFREIEDNYHLARMYEMEQLVYQNTGRYPLALKYGKIAIAELLHSGDSTDLARSYLNLANSYESNNISDSALICYNKALTISRTIHFERGEIACLLGIGNLYFHRYEAAKMRPFFEKALVISRQSEDPQSELIAARGMALYYLLEKDFDKAYAFCSTSVALSDSAGNSYDKYESLNVLSAIKFAQRDIVGAEKIRYEMQLLENELRGEELQQKTISIEKKFETARKEAQIKLQQAQIRQKSIVNYILLGSTIAILIISVLLYRNYKHRQKLQQQRINELETEKQLTATEAILKGEEQERSRLARDLHDGLGGMLSGIKYSLNDMKENLVMTASNAQAFENSIGLLDHSISEMRRVAHNLMPESLLKFGLDAAMRDFCSEMQLNGPLQIHYQSVGLKDKLLDQSLCVAVYRITQELLNNIVKHAGATEAVVQIGATENQLTITVEDNGSGLDAETIQNAQGIGWKNIHSRIHYHKGSVSIQSQPDKGTSVFIEFPIV